MEFLCWAAVNKAASGTCSLGISLPHLLPLSRGKGSGSKWVLAPRCSPSLRPRLCGHVAGVSWACGTHWLMLGGVGGGGGSIRHFRKHIWEPWERFHSQPADSRHASCGLHVTLGWLLDLSERVLSPGSARLLTPLSNLPPHPGTAGATCLPDKHDWAWTTPKLLEGAFELTGGATLGLA